MQSLAKEVLEEIEHRELELEALGADDEEIFKAATERLAWHLRLCVVFGMALGLALFFTGEIFWLWWLRLTHG